MASTNFSAVAAFRDYVETITPDIFREMFYGFDTASLVTVHELVKGEKVWTRQEIGTLIKAWFKEFTPDQTNSLHPVTLRTRGLKIEHSEVPQETESTYLGFLRRNGYNHVEWPLERFTLFNLLAKALQELEDAVWQAERKATPIAAGDSILVVFDGFLKIIKDAITATTITPVVTGPITEANILASMKAMYATLNPAIKRAGGHIRVSYANFDKYVAAMDAQHPNSDVAYTELGRAGYNGIRYRQGAGNWTLIPVAGMADSDRIIFHRSEYFHIGTDVMSDFENFQAEQNKRQLDYWCDFKLGCQITLLKDGIGAVNDQE